MTIDPHIRTSTIIPGPSMSGFSPTRPSRQALLVPSAKRREVPSPRIGGVIGHHHPPPPSPPGTTSKEDSSQPTLSGFHHFKHEKESQAFLGTLRTCIMYARGSASCKRTQTCFHVRGIIQVVPVVWSTTSISTTYCSFGASIDFLEGPRDCKAREINCLSFTY